MKRLGIDVGSTTVKCAVLQENGDILYSSYERHQAKITGKLSELLKTVSEQFPGEKMLLSLSGSAGMGIANELGLPFVQEVYATRIAVRERVPETDTVIELGGEDAKILFLKGTMEVRMNGTCAGGTGAFIDQMAELLSVTPEELNALAKNSGRIYTIASRCGVFAKSDIQPLLNQGASGEDIAKSIFRAVVNQTVAGLSQGRPVEGNVLYLGGPLTFFDELRQSFDEVLSVKGICPEHSLLFVAVGAALSPASEETDLVKLSEKVKAFSSEKRYEGLPQLFDGRETYEAFKARHEKDSGGIRMIEKPEGKMYLGIDAGSTTVKAVLADENGNLCFPMYQSNSGNPVPVVKAYLEKLYEEFPDIEIAGSCVTGYGEDIIRNAFSADLGVVETVAHYTAASFFCPDVDFIIDIGGQDIKCFRIRNHAIDSIFLNEACSSGCGSFLQTFAGVLSLSPQEFSEKALFADTPVDLGSRCTVFMNSSVKQAQKDGACLENIAAGLSLSVVRNALYKVIRVSDPTLLGEHIVVQGGTFLSDAVLRAFELEVGHDVLRPAIAGLMGAYGAALYAKEKGLVKSSIISLKGLRTFTHKVTSVVCSGCENHCRLTVNTFRDGKRYIAGNRCDRPLRKNAQEEPLNLYEFKRNLLKTCADDEKEADGRKTVGLLLGLNLYELLPFFSTLFRKLGYRVILSGESSHELYVKGQYTIPSDTVCYPAKLLHGHLEALLEKKPDLIFYPCMSYQVDEGLGDNHYNCPVVAYYPKVLQNNVRLPENVRLITGFIAINDPKSFPGRFVRMMKEYGETLNVRDVKAAAKEAYASYHAHMRTIREKAQEYMEKAKERNMPVIVLSGRPYHIDPEISHGIDRLICGLGAAVISEDSVALLSKPFQTTVLNQWTYHSRLYQAARFVTEAKDVRAELVQLVSFGCGVDAVTTDEVRSILESRGKLYTQIKIDEITNLGAVRIRLRSLFAACGLKEPEG